MVIKTSHVNNRYIKKLPQIFKKINTQSCNKLYKNKFTSRKLF